MDSLSRNFEPSTKVDVREAVDEAFKEKQRRDEADEAKKNEAFAMIFKKGWARINKLSKGNPTAFRVWTFLAEHCAPNGTLICGQNDMAEAIGVTTRTIRTAIKLLEDQNAIFIIREAAGIIYCLDPSEVWKMAADQKNMSPFRTQAIFSEKSKSVMRRRLTIAKFAAPREIQTDIFDMAVEDKS